MTSVAFVAIPVVKLRVTEAGAGAAGTAGGAALAAGASALTVQEWRRAGRTPAGTGLARATLSCKGRAKVSLACTFRQLLLMIEAISA
jgi:hypothetical protein